MLTRLVVSLRVTDKADTSCTLTIIDWALEIQVHVRGGCIISRWPSTPFGLPHCVSVSRNNWFYCRL